MIDSKLTFKIQEIPDGRSSRKIELNGSELEIEGLSITRVLVEVVFLKTDHFINVDFTVDAGVQVCCDRSLEEYEQPVKGDFRVLFRSDADEADADFESDQSIVKPFNVQELTLSIDKEVRDTIFLELPSKKLHPRFYDSEGQPLEFDTKTFGRDEANQNDSIDPRWEALKKLTKSTD